MLRYRILLFWAAIFPFFYTAQAQRAGVATSVTGKVICGYQGWFNAYGDGSPVARWFHWSNGTYQSNAGAPAPGAIKFELYPSTYEYASADLYTTALGNTNEGNIAKLFSSYKPNVIDKHFEWMQQYGIDGIALQRFISETFDGVFKANRDSVTARVKRSAEMHQRVFYLMYDISGLDAAKFDSIKTDWQNNMIAKLKVTESPYYVYQNNKPVVCIWGFGFTDRSGTAAQCLDVINWFKNNGCYVIGGVPTNWRTGTGDSKTGFSAVYNAFDMISPWSVGRFSTLTGADDFKNNYLTPDLAYCNNNNIAYQPVIFPGFAWSNWNGGTANAIPRNKGEFMWRQVYNIRQNNIGNAYIAMFDEYDEGTAIAKCADSYFAIPNNQYFLTSSADGTYLSEDFYLRLAGKTTSVFKNNETITNAVPIPLTAGPIGFRTSVEQGYDAMPTWTDGVEPTLPAVNIGGYSGTGSPECGVVSEINATGTHSIRYSGRDNATDTSSIYFRVFNVDIPVNLYSKLSFKHYPQNSLARYVGVDLIFSDGSRLSTSAALDTLGNIMHPAVGKGTINTWNKIVSNIGLWHEGKTIKTICIAYDHSAETGTFRGYVDDIAIYEGRNNVYEFIGNGNWKVASNWLNNAVPPAVLTNGYIVINPIENGECILNDEQHISGKNALIINKDKKFVVNGILQITN